MSERAETNRNVEEVDLGEIVKIVDPELDVDAIMAEIRTNLASRPALDPDPSSLVYRPGDAAALTVQSELEWLIEQASAGQQGLAVEEQLRVAPGVVGQLAARAKRPLHQLARFYVETLARQQSAIDGHVVRALAILANRVATQQEEIATLRREVERLKGGSA